MGREMDIKQYKKVYGKSSELKFRGFFIYK